MRALHAVIRDEFEAGVLSTGEWPFYESLGWTLDTVFRAYNQRISA